MHLYVQKYITIEIFYPVREPNVARPKVAESKLELGLTLVVVIGHPGTEARVTAYGALRPLCCNWDAIPTDNFALWVLNRGSHRLICG